MSVATQSRVEQRPAKYPFIDALRGYAVLLVITSHTGRVFAELPYPLTKLTNFGWYGVQLFFLMSCVTLLLSWRSDEAKGRADPIAFWLRRFFRIAPMYYLAAVLYFIIATPPSGFDVRQLLASFLFVNTWYPTWTPTTEGWTVVPGGWSIGVEFTLYLLFPLIAFLVRSRRGVILFCAFAVAAGSLANPIARDILIDRYGKVATDNFLYFWFPNQLIVFALGTILYRILTFTWTHPDTLLPRLARRYATPILLGCVAACIVTTHVPLPERMPPALLVVVPRFVAASPIFMVFATTLGNAPRNLFNNRPIRLLGKVSFSAYLLHFAVLQQATAMLPSIFNPHATGWTAIGTCLALWLFTIPTTFVLSFATYRWVEEPMIAVGRRFTFGRGRLAVAAPSIP